MPFFESEDKRFLDGHGRYVADIVRPRMLEAAIVRSPTAHAEKLSVTKPDLEQQRVFTAEDYVVGWGETHPRCLNNFRPQTFRLSAPCNW